jgi:threonine dehydrogenase-like Zn-dependent dehydrogenase
MSSLIERARAARHVSPWRTLSDAGRPRSGQRRGRPARHSALVAKEIDYRGAFRFDTEFDESIALLAGSTALDPVITHSFDLVDAVAAMDVSAEPAISGKVVLRLSDD